MKPRTIFHYPFLVTLLFSLLYSAVPVFAYHFPWDQGHDTTDWTDPPDPGPCKGATCDPCRSTGSPVYIPTGHFIWSETDIALPGQPEISLTRTFNSHDPRDGFFGKGWTVCGDVGFYQVKGSELQEDGSGAHEVEEFVLRTSNGKRYIFKKNSDGTVTSPPGRNEIVEFLAEDLVKLTSLDGSFRLFDSSGNILQKSDSAGKVVDYHYGDTGMLERIADRNGRYLEFHYHSTGRVAEVVDYIGRQWLFDYNTQGELISTTDPLGNAKKFEYRTFTPAGDAQVYSQLTRIVDESGISETEVTYSGERVNSYTEGENRYSYSYNTGTKTVTKTDLMSHRWTFVYDDRGLITRKTDPLSNSVSIEFDVNGNPVQLKDQLNRYWTSDYDELGRKVSQTNPLNETIRWEYEGENPRPVQIISPSGRISKMEYDARGNLTQMTDSAGSVYMLAWDDQGWLTGVQDPLGNRSAVVNDAQGRPTTITDPLGRTSRFEYDAAGNIAQVKNPAGQDSLFNYDALGRLVTSVDPAGAIIRYQYDPAGRLLSITDAKGNTTVFSYDAYGRLSQKTAPLGRITKYQYRRDNRLSQLTLEDGQIVTFSYDAAGRLTQENAGGDMISYSYNAKGELTSAVNGNATVTLGHDAAGRLIQESQNGQAVMMTLNAEGERIRMSALGQAVDYMRDLRGAVTKITTPAGAIDFEYDAMGRRSRLGRPDGSVVDYTYDAAGQLSEMTDMGAFQAFYRYAYNPAGLITHLTGEGADWEYSYDPAGALIQAQHGDKHYSYAYDPAGNRIGEGQRYDSANRLLEDSQYLYTYDLRGNLTQKQSKATGSRMVFSWNARNQLLRIDEYADSAAVTPERSISYSYGPLGRRLSRDSGESAETYLYDGYDRIASLDSSGQVVQRIFFGPGIDEPLVGRINQEDLYYHANHLGSIMALTDGGGAIAARYAYSPFGQTEESGEINNSFRYTGREYELENLYYYRARYYDAGVGRFVSEDPLRFRGGDFNFYHYAGNNPMNFTDPSGLKTYRCRKPLSFGGTGTKSGPDISGNPLYHQWTCTVTPSGNTVCGGQDRSGSALGSPGRPSVDTFDPQYCQESLPDYEPFEQCLQSEWAKPRPHYGIPFGTDCQEYDDSVIDKCEKTWGVD